MFIPPEHIHLVVQKPLTAQKEFKKNDGWEGWVNEGKKNDYNIPIPFDYNQGKNNRNNNNYEELNNKNQNRHKHKIFENNGNNGWGNDNNNGWGNEGNNKKPVNLFEKLGE